MYVKSILSVFDFVTLVLVVESNMNNSPLIADMVSPAFKFHLFLYYTQIFLAHMQYINPKPQRY